MVGYAWSYSRTYNIYHPIVSIESVIITWEWALLFIITFSLYYKGSGRCCHLPRTSKYVTYHSLYHLSLALFGLSCVLCMNMSFLYPNIEEIAKKYI